MKGFTVIDNKTGSYPDCEKIALDEDWAKHLCYCDIDTFAITEDGSLILMDDCGKCAYCPEGRFTVATDNNVGSKWISVKDRLPEESGMYIVTANDGHAQRVSFVLWQKKNRMWNLTGARSYWRITHWQPMPQPPTTCHMTREQQPKGE